MGTLTWQKQELLKDNALKSFACDYAEQIEGENWLIKDGKKACEFYPPHLAIHWQVDMQNSELSAKAKKHQ